MTDINYQLSKELGDELKRIGATISTVESCTGGGLASSMTDVSGSSQWFTSGLVTYSNFSKKHILEKNFKNSILMLNLFKIIILFPSMLEQLEVFIFSLHLTLKQN